ncbi:Putative formyl transferase [Colletotrichum destructivum]|uniref:phosphoribosylglycinamide formyltransferase 1 n=1 Tax=Colletotrichum destructivum TaxID=34406 RepID=A0AAX4IEL2_9PEZI|nr:Putative formyl transferase [Colletotrichum destructivum]
MRYSPCRILVKVSGFSSNFQALTVAISTSRLPNSRIISLITNRRNAHAIVGADEACIPWDYLNSISNGFLRNGKTDEYKVAESRHKYDSAWAARVLSAGKEKPELIILAGWMYAFSSAFLECIYRKGRGADNQLPPRTTTQPAQGSLMELWRSSELSKRAQGWPYNANGCHGPLGD